jgi:TatD DNase family protein
MNISDQNYYINIHTHSSGSFGDVIQIINLFPEQPVEKLTAQHFYSLGWHPWFIKEDNYEASLQIVSEKSRQPQILAIGECGLDQLSKAPLTLQLKAFQQQAIISERVGKPLLIHCVRAANEMIRLKKEMKPKMPWIIHGFNSNLITGRELIRHGFLISLGADLLKEVSNALNFLPEIPLDRLFLETGDVNIHVNKIYQRAALKLEIEISTLKKQIHSNFNSLFPDYSERNK